MNRNEMSKYLIKSELQHLEAELCYFKRKVEENEFSDNQLELFELLLQFQNDLFEVFDGYVMDKDENLNNDAKELKYKTLNMLKEGFDNAIERFSESK